MLPTSPPKNYKISSAFSYNFILALTRSTGLKKKPKERDEMWYLAWPELYEIDKALCRGDGDIFRVNHRLAEKGFPLWGNDYEE